jgi:hypothetical protein
MKGIHFPREKIENAQKALEQLKPKLLDHLVDIRFLNRQSKTQAGLKG